MLGTMGNLRNRLVVGLLIASAATSSFAQSPEDPAKRAAFLEAALASYQRQLAQANEKVAAAEGMNAVLQKEVADLRQAAAQASAPKEKTK